MSLPRFQEVLVLAHRLAPAALAALVLSSATFAQTLFEDDFESGLGAWAASGRWHLELETDACGAVFAPFPSGSACARFGRIDTPQCVHSFISDFGLLISPMVAIPADDGLRRPELQLRYRYDVTDPDEGYDCAAIMVSTQGSWGPPSSSFGGLCSEDGGARYPQVARWGVYRRDLSSFDGDSLQVGFRMASDDFHNAGGGFLIDDVWIGLVAGDPFCDAEPDSWPWAPSCPCSAYQGWHPDTDTDDGGCIHSGGVRADLRATGLPSLAADGVTLEASGLKASTTALLVQGVPSEPGATFGDGYWCLGAPIRRLLFQQAVQGRVSLPAPGQQPLSVLGGVSIGQTVGYQIYYRDASATYCTSARWNVTNGVAVTWAP